MGVRFPSVQSNTFVGPFPASNAETVVLTSPPFTPPLDSSIILILYSATVQESASTSSLQFNIRRGSTVAGALVNLNPRSGPIQTATLVTLSDWYFDSPGAVSGQQYSITCIQTAAAAASVWKDGAILVFAL